MNAAEKRRITDRVKGIEERLLMIVNPMSRKGSELAARVRSLMRREGMDLEETSTDHPDDTGSTVEFWSKRFGGSRVIMVFGGDGAINQVINNIMLSRSNRKVVLAPMPAGTANDFCHAVGMDGPEGALEALIDFNVKPVDLIRIETNDLDRNPRYCSNIVGVGLDGDLARNALRYKRYGLVGYYYTAFKMAAASLFGGLKTYRFHIRTDSFEFQGSLVDVMCSNIGTYGRILKIAPRAEPDDGKIHLTMVRPMSGPRSLLAGILLLKGKHTLVPEVETHAVTRVTIEALDDAFSQEDGEVVSCPAGTTLELSVDRQALRVVTGPGPGGMAGREQGTEVKVQPRADDRSQDWLEDGAPAGPGQEEPAPPEDGPPGGNPGQ